MAGKAYAPDPRPAREASSRERGPEALSRLEAAAVVAMPFEGDMFYRPPKGMKLNGHKLRWPGRSTRSPKAGTQHAAASGAPSCRAGPDAVKNEHQPRK